MAGEFEDAKNAEHTQRHEGAANIIIVGDAQSDIIRHNGHNINDAHHAAHELAAIGCGEQTQQILGGEDHHARRIQAKEDNLVAFTARQCAGTSGPMAARDCLHHIGHHRDGNEEACDIVEDQRTGRCVRILEGTPHFLTYIGKLL